jgi:large subunit ribosomal protein L17
MRHRKRGRKLGRNATHRKAMFRNMANALFEHEQIITTVAKAKELRPQAEKLITLARASVAANREAKKLREKASEHDHKAQELLDDARRHGTDTDKGKMALEQRRKVLSERYELLAEWRRAVVPVLHARRLLIARIGNHRLRRNEEYRTVVEKLIESIGPRYESRPGGYTRIARLSEPRLGDAGPQAIIALVSDEGRPPRRRKARKAEQESAAAAKESYD